MPSSTILSDNGVSSGTSGIKTSGGNDGLLLLQTTTAGGTATTAVTVDTSQNVGIGTSSPVDRLDIGSGRLAASSDTTTPTGGSAYFYKQSAGATVSGYQVIIETGSGGSRATRATFDSSGNFLVGTTSGVGSAGILQAVQATSTGNAVISADAQAASYAYNVLYLNTTRAASTAFNFINCTSSSYSNAQFRVRGDGVIYAQNTAVQSISDVRTKENIRDSSDGLAVIAALRPVRYDFKSGFGNDKKNQLGFIAQEIETVFPDAVGDTGEATPDGDTYKTVGPAALIPVLVKAIQEQQKMIETLRVEVAELKAKV